MAPRALCTEWMSSRFLWNRIPPMQRSTADRRLIWTGCLRGSSRLSRGYRRLPSHQHACLKWKSEATSARHHYRWLRRNLEPRKENDRWSTKTCNWQGSCSAQNIAYTLLHPVQSPMATRTCPTQSEVLLTDYFRHNGFRYESQPSYGCKVLDFHVLGSGGECQGVYEVKEFEADAGTGQAISNRPGPCDGIRSKIGDSWPQFQAVGNRPCMLVLYSATVRQPITPTRVAAAMFGWPTVCVDLEGHSRAHKRTTVVYGTGGKVIDRRSIEEDGQVGNKLLSAIGILSLEPLHHHLSGFLHRC